MSCGIDLVDSFRQAGVHAGEISHGANPADPPVLQPTKFEFVIKSEDGKKRPGIYLPALLLVAAGRVIER